MLDDAPVLPVELDDVPVADLLHAVAWPIPPEAELVGVEDDYLRVRHPGKKKPKYHEVSLRAEGLLQLHAAALRLEYRLLGTFDEARFTGPPQVADVPLSAVRAMRVQRAWIGRHRLIVEPRTLTAFAPLPVRVTGPLSLPVRRADRPLAEALVAEARYRAAQLAIGELS
jgi:hypothetical protein